MLADIDDAEAALSARRIAPKGRLRLTAPVTFGRMHVAPVVTDFIGRHAAVQVELMLLDRVVDLVEEGIDVGVRIGHLPDSSLVALPIGETRRVVCASPAYLKRAGTPASPADLAAHRCVSFGGLAQGNDWTLATAGKTVRVRLTPGARRRTRSTRCWRHVRRGAGLGQFLSYQVKDLLEARRAEASARRIRAGAAADPRHLSFHAASCRRTSARFSTLPCRYGASRRIRNAGANEAHSVRLARAGAVRKRAALTYATFASRMRKRFVQRTPTRR